MVNLNVLHIFILASRLTTEDQLSVKQLPAVLVHPSRGILIAFACEVAG